MRKRLIVLLSLILLMVNLCACSYDDSRTSDEVMIEQNDPLGMI